MNKLQFKNISENLDQYEGQIELLLNSLTSEKEFFITFDKKVIMRADLVIAAFDGQTMIGITGFEKKYFLHKSFSMVRKDYQKLGVGAFLFLRRIEEARKRYDIILNMVNPQNTLSIQMTETQGGKYLGKRYDHVYLMLPLNKKGFFIFYLLKIGFPILILWDIFESGWQKIKTAN